MVLYGVIPKLHVGGSGGGDCSLRKVVKFTTSDSMYANEKLLHNN